MIVNKDEIMKHADNLLIKDFGCEVDPNCGWDVTIVTDDDIEALNNGKFLFMDDGEYTHIFVKGG